MRNSFLAVASATALSLLRSVDAKAVFAHYMVGSTTEDHMHKDINAAKAMGFDGFALNIADPNTDFARDAMSSMFGYAGYVGGFKLYVSMDLYAYGDGCSKQGIKCNGMFDYHDLLAGYLGHPAWFRDTPNGFPLISTFSSGGFQWADFNKWKLSFANQMYFIPDIDETNGYYGSSDDWWYYWGNITEGVFSWETSWPISSTRLGYGGYYAGDVTVDKQVIAAAKKRNKGYMIGLSTLQYKNSYGANVYRGGELNLPTRMEGILNMPIQPDYVQVITWNDFPEGHNMGTVWPEQNTDLEPLNYGNEYDWPHEAWQNIHTSFFRTWKAGGKIGDMRPVNPANQVEGVMWYKTILQSSQCPNGAIADKYHDKPDNFDTGKDQINYSVVVAAGVTGLYVRCTSGGSKIGQDRLLVPGLNYGGCQGVQPGNQKLTIVDASGAVLYGANGVACVDSGCPNGIYNMNYQVVALGPDSNHDCYDYSRGGFIQTNKGLIFAEHDFNLAAPWRDVSCSAGALTKITNDGAQQWKDAKADEAWNDFIYSWKHASPLENSKGFLVHFHDYFHAQDDLTCGEMTLPGCVIPISCGEGGFPNAPINSPAGYIILGSFTGIKLGFAIVDDAILRAEIAMAARIGKFSSTFSPLYDNQKGLKIALDVLGLVWGVFAAPMWNIWLKSAPHFAANGNQLGTTKDTVNGLISGGITLAKDTSALGKQNNLNEYLIQVAHSWESLLNKELATLFDGSDASINALYNVIKDAKAFYITNSTTAISPLTLEPLVEKSLWAYMIPYAWSQSSVAAIPFIATSEGVPQDAGQSGCNGWSPTLVKGGAHLNHDDGIQNFVCGVGTDLKPYWISNIKWAKKTGCDLSGGDDCATAKLGTLPGIDKLSGSGIEGEWGVSRDDLVISALTAYKKNGNKNGWAKADPTNPNVVSDIYDNGINAVGFVNIPICSFAEAINNIIEGNENTAENFPCN